MPALSIIVLSALIPLGPTNATDPLSRYDDLIISAEVQNECHLNIPGPLSEAKLNKIVASARAQMWRVVYDQRVSSEGNWHKADEMMLKRTGDDQIQGEKLVAAQGCAALISHAREVLMPYSQ